MKFDRTILLAYYFPPIKSIGVIRNHHLAREFLNISRAVNVITTSNQSRLPNEALEIPNQVNVEQAYTFDYRTISSMLRKSEETHISESAKKGFFGKIAVKLLRSFPFNLIIGEGGFFYILNSIRKASKIIEKADGQVLLYSSFPTYSDHFIASVLRKRFSNTYWIADFRDLHTDPLYDLVFWRKVQHWFNKATLKRADLVTTVSEGLTKQLQKYHGNIHVLRNGVAIKIADKKTASKKLTIAYTGSLFADERDPRPLFAVLSKMIDEDLLSEEKISVVYAGKDGAQMQSYIDEYGLNRIFKNKGMLTRADALQLQRNADFNLLLTSSHSEMSGVLTGKLFEYLSTGNPILLLIKGQRDEEFENIFHQLNAGNIFYHNQDSQSELKKYLLNIYQEWLQNGKINHEVNVEELKRSFSWEKSIKDLQDKMSM